VYHAAEGSKMDCDELRTSVLEWFGSEMECRSTGPGSMVMTMPILKPNGDPIELGFERLGERSWTISDLGETYSTLFLAGVELNDEYVRADEFRRVLTDHGISDLGEELVIETSSDSLIETVFDFLQAVQSMLALQLTIKPKQPSRDFAAVVAKFLAEQQASFEIPALPIEGKTGPWRFNFSLNHVQKETLVKAITAASKPGALHQAEQSVFEIRDVQEIRNSDAVVITDDEGDRSELWTPRVLRLFTGYGIPVIPFEAGRNDLMKLAQKYAR
jgi:hypothetical protein